MGRVHLTVISIITIIFLWFVIVHYNTLSANPCKLAHNATELCIQLVDIDSNRALANQEIFVSALNNCDTAIWTCDNILLLGKQKLNGNGAFIIDKKMIKDAVTKEVLDIASVSSLQLSFKFKKKDKTSSVITNIPSTNNLLLIKIPRNLWLQHEQNCNNLKTALNKRYEELNYCNATDDCSVMHYFYSCEKVPINNNKIPEINELTAFYFYGLECEELLQEQCEYIPIEINCINNKCEIEK